MANPKEQKPSVQREKLAGFLYDLGKLVFGGLVVGTLTPLVVTDLSDLSVLPFILGGVATIIFAFVANRLLKTK